MKKTNCGGGYIYTIPKSDIERLKCIEGIKYNEDIRGAYARVTKLYGRAPDFFMNAELFDFTTRKPASDVVVDGKAHRLTQTYGIAFKDYKDPVFSYNNNVNAPDYIGAYPVLVRNGKKETSEPKGIGGVRGRTALGVSKDNFYVALIPDKSGVSLSTLRNHFISVGTTDAINLDGGGSTQGYFPDGNYYTGRNVRGFIGVWLKKSGTTNNTKADVRRVSVVGKLRVRSGAGYGYKRVDLLNNGDVVTVIETSGSWCKIGEGRWVNSLYLKKK